MAKGWPAGVSKVEYKAYKQACEAAATTHLGARDFQADLNSGMLKREFFANFIPKDANIMVGGNATPNVKVAVPRDINSPAAEGESEEQDSDLIPIPGTDAWGVRASRREWLVWHKNIESGAWYPTPVGFRKIEDAIIYVARELQREKILGHKDLTKLGQTNLEVFKTFENCIKKSFFTELEGKIKKLSENG